MPDLPIWPDNETELDLLGFDHLAKAVTNLATSSDLLPATIGVFGDWGSGKSSLMRMVGQELNERRNTLVVHFNGWLFEGYDDAKSVLLETVVNAISNQVGLGPKVMALGIRLLRRIKVMDVVRTGVKYGVSYATTGGATTLGLLAGDIAKLCKHVDEELSKKDETELKKLLQTEKAESARRNIQCFREEFQELLGEAKLKYLVVLIDDLDRCLPERIIETLEAIKLFLFVPGSAFIIGADERLVRYAVRRRFPEIPGDNAEVGRDYLEKLIQFPIRIPALSRVEIENYLGLLLTGKNAPHDGYESMRKKLTATDAIAQGGVITVDLIKECFGNDCDAGLLDCTTLCAQLAPILAAGMNGNPRQTKRFLNTLAIRLMMAGQRGIELKPRVLAKLMLLEYFKPESFKELANAQAGEGGFPKFLRDLEAAGQDAAGEVVDSPWMKDSWLKAWLDSEPQLRDIDLREYVYFSRDRLGTISVAAQRLNPKAQEFLIKIISTQSKAGRNNHLKGAKSLSELEASSIFDSLAEKSLGEDDWSTEDSVISRLFDFVEHRQDLLSQLVTFIKTVPENRLPIWVPVKLKAMADSTSNVQMVEPLINHWAEESVNTNLQRAAKGTLSRRSK